MFGKAGFLACVKITLTVAAQRRTSTVFHLYALASGLAGHLTICTFHSLGCNESIRETGFCVKIAQHTKRN